MVVFERVQFNQHCVTLGVKQMISVKSAVKLLASGAAVLAVATGCATAKHGEAAMPAAQPVAEAAEPESMASDSYTVASGDHLWGISSQEAVYGDPYDWPILFSHNRAQIKDADLIYPGQVFTVPREFKPREVANARNHAKTRGPWVLGAVEESDTAFLAANPVDMAANPVDMAANSQ